MLTILLTCLLTLVAASVGWYGHRWTLRHRSASEQRSEKRCDVCHVELPKGTYRTHSGKWRCAAHKQDAA